MERENRGLSGNPEGKIPGELPLSRPKPRSMRKEFARGGRRKALEGRDLASSNRISFTNTIYAFQLARGLCAISSVGCVINSG